VTEYLRTHMRAKFRHSRTRLRAVSLLPVQIWCDRLDTRTYVHTCIHTDTHRKSSGSAKVASVHVSVISYVAPSYARNVNQQELALARGALY